MSSTGFVNGSTLTDAGWFNDTDTDTYKRLTSVSGTNTIVGTGPVSMTAYAVGQEFAFIPAATNTGATTLNITPSGSTALGAKNIFWNGAACVGGEIRINVPVKVWYDGTQFNLVAQPTTKVLGTTTNDSATAGYLGEYIESVVGPVNFPTSGQYKDLTSISLTAGDWDVSVVYYGDANSGSWSAIGVGISTTSGNSATGLVNGSNIIYGSWANSGLTPLTVGGSLANYRMSLSATTTVYAKLYGAMSSGTPTCSGRLSARRVR